MCSKGMAARRDGHHTLSRATLSDANRLWPVTIHCLAAAAVANERVCDGAVGECVLRAWGTGGDFDR